MDKKRGMFLVILLLLLLMNQYLSSSQSLHASFLQEPTRSTITVTESPSDANWPRRMLGGRNAPNKSHHHKHHHTYSSSASSNSTSNYAVNGHAAGALTDTQNASILGNTQAGECTSPSPQCANNGTTIDPRYGVEKRLVPTGPNPLHNWIPLLRISPHLKLSVSLLNTWLGFVCANTMLPWPCLCHHGIDAVHNTMPTEGHAIYMPMWTFMESASMPCLRWSKSGMQANQEKTYMCVLINFRSSQPMIFTTTTYQACQYVFSNKKVIKAGSSNVKESSLVCIHSSFHYQKICSSHYRRWAILRGFSATDQWH